MSFILLIFSFVSSFLNFYVEVTSFISALSCLFVVYTESGGTATKPTRKSAPGRFPSKLFRILYML